MADETMKELFGSDDDSSEDSPVNKPEEDTTMKDLFGDDDDDDDSKENEDQSNPQPQSSPEPQVPTREQTIEKEKSEMDELFGSDDEGGTHATTLVTRPEYSAPSHSTLCITKNRRMSDDPQILLRTPNFLKIQSTAFDPATYNGDLENELFPQATSVIRWRYKTNSLGEKIIGADGKPIRESNARLVKWSDGSYQLVVGDEVFNAGVLPQTDSFIYAHRKSVLPTNTPDEPETDSQQEMKTQTCLQCVGHNGWKMNLQPTSVDSVSHERMSLIMNEKFRKQTKVKKASDFEITGDPEKDAEARAAAFDEAIRKERRRKRQEMASEGRGVYRRSGGVGGAAMSAAYLQQGMEDDDQYDSTSLRDIKRGKVKAPVRPRYDSEDEDDDGDYGDEEEMKGFIVNDDEEGEEGWGDEDAEYEEEGPVSSKKSKPSSKRTEKVRERSSSEELDDGEDEDGSVERKRPNANSVAVSDDDDEDNDLSVKTSVPMRKRAKRAIVESDDEDI
mmetsp:Transcript_21059/g.30418  ORF Transcript_21059/g.30418 Transcript_21059/m.30418 type:complete len:503 (+) Transcript_21059:28-1536(+)